MGESMVKSKKRSMNFQSSSMNDFEWFLLHSESISQQTWGYFRGSANFLGKNRDTSKSYGSSELTYEAS